MFFVPDEVCLDLLDALNLELRRSESSVLKKSYTSNDELDQLDLNFIISEVIATSPFVKSSRISEASRNGNGNVVRYQILHEV
ncbi:hypothetical protein CQW23_14670 [Capsicum baccatum]|uniref:Uncharacterized protein n=1 Tax=Capsicum baccatum TaxID=33114 RepID=A0A2G2WJX0_CAPBA|nr:hypothetical protein CQW23_14670 [Capsicum baccatum]